MRLGHPKKSANKRDDSVPAAMRSVTTLKTPRRRRRSRRCRYRCWAGCGNRPTAGTCPLIVCGYRRQAKTAFIPSSRGHWGPARGAHGARHSAGEYKKIL